MTERCGGRVAILYPGDQAARLVATPENNRFSAVFRALAERGARVEAAVYEDELCEEVRQQLLGVDAVLVWVNPLRDGRDRSRLDAMLLEVAAAGVFVSAHPRVIEKIGTKEVLVRTRDLGWGCDTHLICSVEQMRRELPARLASGSARVLKQLRGNGGCGVWRVALAGCPAAADCGFGPTSQLDLARRIRVRHAKRGSVEEEIPLSELLARFEPLVSEAGQLIDQAYQARLPEGMVRCYLVHDVVMGFGHQALNALLPAPPGAPLDEAPEPGPRLYHPPTMPEFQALRRRLEEEWVPAMQRLLGIDTQQLPVLWDCDFLLGPKEAGEDTYVLCEINASSVAPFPDSVVAAVADATLARVPAERRGPS